MDQQRLPSAAKAGIGGFPIVSSAWRVLLLLVSAQYVLAQSNPIVRENSLPGNPSSQWDISGAGDSSIQGFATDISANKGDTVHFKINTTASAYQISIYRLGYY